ncbi:MAG: I78 family peptidase inhibitor [Paracoccus sp. (in: a-proteobacteria)]|nr:I78 family peptidase inhibitor [Paracoccus sp. (in: a-proteobacteria)]
MRYLIPTVLLLAGCAEQPSALQLVCGPEHGAMVGRNIGEFELPRGLAYRVIQPGAAVPDGTNPARLNIRVDDKGWISAVTCG